ncbi:hypothetical protein T459_26676 [Capsicum annuum]|uniref:Zinc finger PMZ-type domain-containing protein n=1 Tax=Capsicum annuum TaxID=4072 RepID=A0A2G2YBV8_CAPAN|nr:hypothetical protein T459_26676 [Capsicum annuum]
MPCEHAMTALRAKYGDDEDYGNSIYDYSSPIYKAESYLLAYSEAINVVLPEAEWTVPQKLVETRISPPPYDPKLGRKKVKLTKGVSEIFKSKRNDLDRIFYGLGQDRIYLERELRRIAHFLRAILERLGMEGPDYITPPPSL